MPIVESTQPTLGSKEDNSNGCETGARQQYS